MSHTLSNDGTISRICCCEICVARRSALPPVSPPEIPDSFWALLHGWRLAHREWEIGGPNVTRGKLDRIADRIRVAYCGRAALRDGPSEPSEKAMEAAVEAVQVQYPNLGFHPLRIALRAAYAIDCRGTATPPEPLFRNITQDEIIDID